MAITTTARLAPPIQAAFNRRLLSVEEPNLIYTMCADQVSMPRKSGDTMRWRLFDKLKKAMVPLGNSGRTPPSQEINATNIDAKMSFYGRMCAVVKSFLIDLEAVIAI